MPRCWKAGSRLHKARSRDRPGFSLSFRPGLDQGKDEFAAIRKRFKIEKALTRPIPTLCAPAVGFLCVPGPAQPTRSTQLRALARVPFCAVFSLGGLSRSLSMSHMVFVFNFLFRGLHGSEKDGFCRNSLPCAGTIPLETCSIRTWRRCDERMETEHTVGSPSAGKVAALGSPCFTAKWDLSQRHPKLRFAFSARSSVLQVDQRLLRSLRWSIGPRASGLPGSCSAPCFPWVLLSQAERDFVHGQSGFALELPPRPLPLPAARALHGLHTLSGKPPPFRTLPAGPPPPPPTRGPLQAPLPEDSRLP